MVCIFFEGSQYIPLVEEVIGVNLQTVLCTTPYGDGKILLNEAKNVLCVTNAGMAFNKQPVNIPKAVMYVLLKYDVKQMCIVSKVGGINKLIHVGDTVISSDYVDKTTIYQKSYLMDYSELPPRYDMLDVFSVAWRKCIRDYLFVKRREKGFNIFDKGIYVCTDGPGFESQAEIESYRRMDADIVGHYLSPYMYYARELSIALACVSVVSNSFYNEDPILVENEDTNELFRTYIEAVLSTADAVDCDEHRHHQMKNIVKLS